MKRRYYTNPPMDIPPFLLRRHLASHMSKMIQWAIKEYRDLLRGAAEHGAYRAVKFMNEEYSPMRLLSECEGFKEMMSYITEENYNQISHKERVFIRRSYELFCVLGK